MLNWRGKPRVWWFISFPEDGTSSQCIQVIYDPLCTNTKPAIAVFPFLLPWKIRLNNRVELWDSWWTNNVCNKAGKVNEWEVLLTDTGHCYSLLWYTVMDTPPVTTTGQDAGVCVLTVHVVQHEGSPSSRDVQLFKAQDVCIMGTEIQKDTWSTDSGYELKP